MAVIALLDRARRAGIDDCALRPACCPRRCSHARGGRPPSRPRRDRRCAGSAAPAPARPSRDKSRRRHSRRPAASRAARRSAGRDGRETGSPARRRRAAAAGCSPPPRRGAALQLTVDQVRDHFGVGLALELAALGDQLVAQRLEILDDAVVDQRHFAGGVRMGIASVGAPWVAQRVWAMPIRPGERMLRQPVPRLASLPSARRRSSSPSSNGDAGRVIAAVFEALEALEQPRGDVGLARGYQQSAHVFPRLSSPPSTRGISWPSRRCLFACRARPRGCPPPRPR